MTSRIKSSVDCFVASSFSVIRITRQSFAQGLFAPILELGPQQYSMMTLLCLVRSSPPCFRTAQGASRPPAEAAPSPSSSGVKCAMSFRACIHLSLSMKCFEKISADICRVGQYSKVKSLRSKCSHHHDKQMPCVRCTCLIVGFLPASSTRIAAALSSLNTAESFLTPPPSILSHNDKDGMPIDLMAMSAATISASGVEWDTLVCFMLIAARGKNVSLRVRHRNAPDVE